MQRIPVAGPWITQKEIDYTADAAANAWYSQANTYYQRFEKAFADYVGCKYAICLPSCTSAIHLSLMAMGVGPGDEVIVPDGTWIASAAPINYVGATTVFADIDPVTWCLSPSSFEASITPRTKAVIGVNLYGSMVDWKSIRKIADAHKIAVIEDAAESIGSEYHGKRSGSFGDTGVFSFHGSKTLTTGEGGMLVTSSDELRNRVLFLRDHGRPPGDKMFYNTEVAYKYKMSSLQAAMGLAQLERIEELVGRKRDVFSWYQEKLAGLPGISLNAEPVGTRNSYWMSTIVWDERYPFEKLEVMRKLDMAGIDTRPFFHPLSSLPAYTQVVSTASAKQRNIHTYKVCQRGINLPSALCLTKEQVAKVCEEVKNIFVS